MDSVTGGIRPPRAVNYVNQLRRFSTALSAFISSYDELQNQFSLINSSIDLIFHVANPNQSPPRHLSELETVTCFTDDVALVQNYQNPKDSERIGAIATKLEVSHSLEASKKNVGLDACKNYEEIDVTNPKQSPVTRLLESERDKTVTGFSEVVVAERNPRESASDRGRNDNSVERTFEGSELLHDFEGTGGLKKIIDVDVLKDCEDVDVFEKDVESDSSKKCKLKKDCEEIVVFEKDVEGDTWKKCEKVDVSTKHAETDASNTAEEIVSETFCDQITTAIPGAIDSELNPNRSVRTSLSLEEIDTLNKTDETIQETSCDQTITDFCKNPEEIGALKFSEKNDILNKHEETETSKKSVISVLESLCQTMSYKEMNKHVTTHIFEMVNLSEEVANALKLAEDPAKLVLDSIGMFFKAGSGRFRKGFRYAEKLASVLILECFVMISSDGIEIAKEDQRYASAKAVLWRKRIIKDGGLSHADEVDARGLLLLISGFGIPDFVFKIQDIVDLVRASNVKGISSAIRRSVFLIPKIPEVIDFMVKNNLEIEAVDLAYTFGMEDMCYTPNILTTYLQKKLKFIQSGSSGQMLEAMKQQLFDLKSVKQCLESHNIDPSTLLPEFKVNEGIQKLEKEVNEGTLIQKGKFPEEIDTSKKLEESETSKKSMISVLESLCQSMSYKELNKHVARHIFEMINLHEEISKALKLAKEPAKLVLNSIGKGYGFHQENEKAGRLASVLILECFVMISLEIPKRDCELAAIVAVIWRKRIIREGGLRHTEEVDARGLLLLISGFGIQDHVFTIEDITDLIIASNVKGISIALRRSVFLIPKIPEVIYFMVKNDLVIEAVDLAFTFGLEDSCHPQKILTTYLNGKLKVIQNGSSVQMLETMKQQLFDLESVKQCLESHNINPSMLLPEFQVNEKIQNLEKEINEWKLFPKRKSPENSIHQESKRACFDHENMLHQHKHVLKKPDVIDASGYPEETDVSNKPVEIDNYKECEETVPETSCDQTICVVSEAVISEQNHNGTVSDCEQIHENVKTPESLEEIVVSMKPKEIETLNKTEETVPETSCDQTTLAVPEAIISEQNPDGTVADCENIHENVRTPEILIEIDTLKKRDETIQESSCDQTVTAVPEVIVSGQNPDRMVTNCEQIPEEVDVSKKPEQTDFRKNPEENDASHPEEIVRPPKILEEINVSKKPKASSTSKKPVRTKKPKVISTSKKPELTDFCKNPEEIDTLKKHEETNVKKKATETGTSKNPVISALEILCQSMNSNEMNRHVVTHISKMVNLRPEIAKALKLAKDPAKLVLNSIGRFFVQSSRPSCKVYGFHHEDEKARRLAFILILECFVMISSDGIEIVKSDRELAAAEAVIWKKRMIIEGGLRHTEEVDARGLLLLISGFGIQDHDFTIQDITDLVRASNVKEIATALRRSVYLIPKIPEVVDLMTKNNLEIEAVDIAYTFGLEDACRPKNILSIYLRDKVKDIRNGSSFQTMEAMKQQLCDLQSVKQCLESHKVDPSMLLPKFKINERIQNLEKEISEWNLTQKRKSSENPIHQEPKRACLGRENMQNQLKRPDHYDMNPYSSPTPPSTWRFNVDRNPTNSYIPNYSLPSIFNAPAIRENIHGPLANGVARGLHGSYDQMVHRDNVQGWRGEYDQNYLRHGQTYGFPNDVRPSGWHGSYGEHYSRHGQTYESQPYRRPQGWSPLEPFPRYVDSASGFLGRRGPSLSLYRFADIVEKDTRGFRSSGTNGA